MGCCKFKWRASHLNLVADHLVFRAARHALQSLPHPRRPACDDHHHLAPKERPQAPRKVARASEALVR